MPEMIEDMQHLQVLDNLNREIYDLIANYNRRTVGIKDKDTLALMRLEQLKDLMDLIARQNRALRYMLGEKVEPEVQFAEATLRGFGGGAAR